MTLPENSFSRRLLTGCSFLFAVALVWTFGSTDLRAQQWQYVYGGDNTYEEGMRGVTPVTNACRSYPSCQSCTTQSNGYIAVGSTGQSAFNTDDVYVVRTDNNGASIWEATYDISGSGSDDKGTSIVQLSDGSGFAITGHTTTGTTTDLFILKIDCDGAVLWTRTYRGPILGNGASGVYGEDILEATTGNSSYSTSPGDLVVAGSVATSEYEDGIILRTTSTGTLIWNAAYDEPNPTREIFDALTELAPVSPETAGDIIAVGRWNNSRGYVARVNGNTGAIGTPLQGTAMHWNSSLAFNDFFYSVVELQNPNETGTNGQPNVVLAGLGTAINGGTEIFLVKLDDGDPCSPLTQTLVGDGSSTSPTADHATDIQEIPFALTGTTNLAQWDLVVTGSTSTPSGGTNAEAFLLGIDPGTLGPIANTGMAYHPTGSNDGTDIGWSLAIVGTGGGATQGVVMGGTTNSDWLQTNDPRDMYLLKTNSALSTGLACEESYNPGYARISGDNCGDANYTSVLSTYTVQTSETGRDWGDVVCTNSSNSGKAVPGFGSHESHATEVQAAYQVSIYGNPVRTGEELRLAFDGDELPGSVAISVTNSRGEEILSTTVSVEAGTVSLATSNWPTGTCFITINDRGYRRMLRAVILD